MQNYLTLTVLRQVRDLLTTDPVRRVEHFRWDRVQAIKAGETPVELDASPRVVLHVVPLNAFGAEAPVQITAVDPKMLPVLYSRGFDPRYNSNGLLTYAKGSGYTQLFRNGIIEAVAVGFFRRGILPPPVFSQEMQSRVGEYAWLQRELRLATPIAFILSLVGVRECSVAVSDHETVGPFDVDDLLCQPVVVEDLEMIDPMAVLRPAFERIANASGQRSWMWNANVTLVR